jgi:hypothetical protein
VNDNLLMDRLNLKQGQSTFFSSNNRIAVLDRCRGCQDRKQKPFFFLKHIDLILFLLTFSKGSQHTKFLCKDLHPRLCVYKRNFYNHQVYLFKTKRKCWGNRSLEELDNKIAFLYWVGFL